MTPSPVCAKLHQDFDSNEKNWSYDAVVNNILREAAYKTAMSGGGNASDRARYAEYVANGKDIDTEHAEKADRIVTIIVANKCTPPDHVASAAKYWDLAIGKEVEARRDENN